MAKKAVILLFLVLFFLLNSLNETNSVWAMAETNKSDLLLDPTLKKQVASMHSLAEAPEHWNMSYGGNSDDLASSVIQVADGGFILVGSTASYGTLNNYDAWLIKTDAQGILQWQRVYGTTWINDWAYSVIETTDGGLAFAGFTASVFTESTDGWLVKTDSFGNQNWNQTYGGSWSDLAFTLIQTPDEGFALVGATTSYSPGDSDGWLVKTDENGIMQWNQTYGSSGSDKLLSGIHSESGGFVLCGKRGKDAWLVKTDENGNMQWEQTFGSEGDDWTNAMIQTGDGYVLVGSTTSYGADAVDAWLIKTDRQGKMQWHQRYGDSLLQWTPRSRGASWDEAASVIQTVDRGFMLVGFTMSSSGSRDAWLVKTDEYGAVQWSEIFGGSEDDVATAVIETLDGGFVFTGSTLSFGAGSRDAWLVKMNALDIEYSTRVFTKLRTLLLLATTSIIRYWTQTILIVAALLGSVLALKLWKNRR